MPARKRAAIEALEEPRRSRRVSSTKTSTYFEGEDSESDVKVKKAKKTPLKRSQKYEESEDEVDLSLDEDSDDDFDEEMEEDDLVVTSKKVKKTPTKIAKSPSSTKKTSSAKTGKGAKTGKRASTSKQAEMTGEEEADEDDEDAFKEKVIPIVQLRDTGGVAYVDERLHKNTMLFLKDLKANNQRHWLKAHDGEYRRSLKDWQSFVEDLGTKITDVDFTIPELPAKDLIFRIHRDVRFSKDQTPYKAHYSAAWSRTGKKGPYACYYVHCEPGASFVGGGLWHPEAPAVQKLRASIDERPHRWRRVLNDERFKRTFLPDVANKAGEEAALKAFAEKNQENALKTKPKGFVAEHRDIELLKLRNYTISTKIEDKLFTTPNGPGRIIEIIGAMVGFITFLNSVVMPDPNLDDDSDSDSDSNAA